MAQSSVQKWKRRLILSCCVASLIILASLTNENDIEQYWMGRVGVGPPAWQYEMKNQKLISKHKTKDKLEINWEKIILRSNARSMYQIMEFVHKENILIPYSENIGQSSKLLISCIFCGFTPVQRVIFQIASLNCYQDKSDYLFMRMTFVSFIFCT